MEAADGDRCGTVAQTSASGTGSTGSVSAASVRPAFSGSTVERPRHSPGGTSSPPPAQRNILRIRFTLAFTPGQDSGGCGPYRGWS
jgi:hypothetical protein